MGIPWGLLHKNKCLNQARIRQREEQVALIERSITKYRNTVKLYFLNLVIILLLIDKKEVSLRLIQIIKEKFDGVDIKFSKSANLTPSTLQGYIRGSSLPGGQNLARLAKAGGVTTDWIIFGPEAHYGIKNDPGRTTEHHPGYKSEVYTDEEKQLVEDYRAASDAGRETGRMVFRMNPKEQKKCNHPLRRKTDPVKKNAGSD